MGQVQLLAYADRLGGDLAGVRELLEGPLSVFTGVHLLPFYHPYDGDDAGFDPIDHTSVDGRLGSWADIRQIARERTVMADVIVNHMSAASPQFTDWLAHGERSAYDGLFLTFDRVFGGRATEADITGFYRPRPGLPFTAYTVDGVRRLVWTTFMPTQVDIDVQHPAGQAYLRRVIDTLAAGGVSIVRIDAVGYAIKTPGTDSFMTDHTLTYVSHLVEMCHQAGLQVLVEVHAHYTQQQRIAALVDYVYDFALPGLLLHSFVAGTPGRLAHWLDIRPANAVTVLDTHDGIGIIDAGPASGLPGLITQGQMTDIFTAADRATGGIATAASQLPQWCTVPHQINSTFYSVLGADPVKYLICRLVQLLTPGIPQVYYVGLLTGCNDIDRWHASGQGREINRHAFTRAEIDQGLHTEVVQAMFALITLRRDHIAFEGEFSHRLADNALTMTWRHPRGRVSGTVTFDPPAFRLEVESGGHTQRYATVASLARRHGAW